MAHSIARAVTTVNKHGLLLVYPLQNRPDPPSLWQVLHPGVAMEWVWDSSADGRVAELWHLRSHLARDRRVVYSKWFQNRATLASRDVFCAMLRALRATGDLRRGLSRDARRLLEILEDDSPQPTRALRDAAGLAGRAAEADFTRAMRSLWSRLLIVGAGEAEEGGFPSLAVGATSLLFEDLWDASERADPGGEKRLEAVLARSPAFERAFRRVRREMESAPG